MKFGGTSLGDVTKIKAQQSELKEVSKGKIVSVVSAMAGSTIKLIKLVNEISETYDKSEYDVVISTEEQVSAGLLVWRKNNRYKSDLGQDGNYNF